MFLLKDNRDPDYWLDDVENGGIPVDLSDEFIERYEEAVMAYDAIQAELELIYKSKDI